MATLNLCQSSDVGGFSVGSSLGNSLGNSLGTSFGGNLGGSLASPFHSSFLSLLHLHKHYHGFDPGNSLAVSTGSLTLKSPRPDTSQVSSSLSDCSDTSSARENVIVRNDFKRKKSSTKFPENRELVKDEAYWERRKKNNDAAKRSRDHRRIKEDEMASRAAVLEVENVRLRGELELLRSETDQLRTLLLSPAVNDIKAPTPLRVADNGYPSGPFGDHSGSSGNGDFASRLHCSAFPDSTQRNSVLVANFMH